MTGSTVVAATGGAPRPAIRPGERPVPDLTGSDAIAVIVADLDGRQLAVDLGDLTRLGAVTITGPHAAGAVRATVVTMLSTSGSGAIQVVAAGQRLLGDAAELDGLRRAADLNAALGFVEAELIGRTRLLEDSEQLDAQQPRPPSPIDQSPALVLVADELPAGQAARLAAVLDQGRGLRAGALLAGVELEQAARITLDQDAHVLTAHPPSLAGARLPGARVRTLDARRAAEALRSLAATRPAHQTETSGKPNAQAIIPSTPACSSDPPGAAAGLPARPALAQPENATAAGAPVAVRLLGRYEITVGGNAVGRGLRRSARELLAYLLLHPEGVRLGQAVETLWPDTAPGKERERFWNALGNLRHVLRGATGLPIKLIGPAGGHYQPGPEVFEVDLWRFHRALETAGHASDPATRATVLRKAVDAYGGTLLDGEAYDWAEPHRQTLRDQATDALLRLAEECEQSGDEYGALTLLDRAIQIDPLAEESYRRLMRLQATRGRFDLAERAYRRLQDRLEELDARPDIQTKRLLLGLLRRSRDRL